MTTLEATSRQSLRTELLHLIEDESYEGGALVTVKDLVTLTEKSDSTVRKALKDLLTGGFIAPVEGYTPTAYVAVRKDAEEEVNMTDETKTKRGRDKDPAVQARDAQVLELIKAKPEGRTVAELAQELNVKPGIAYLSIWRLKASDQVVKTRDGGRAPRWKVA